jgi:hypothetical protein
MTNDKKQLLKEIELLEDHYEELKKQEKSGDPDDMIVRKTLMEIRDRLVSVSAGFMVFAFEEVAKYPKKKQGDIMRIMIELPIGLNNSAKFINQSIALLTFDHTKNISFVIGESGLLVTMQSLKMIKKMASEK